MGHICSCGKPKAEGSCLSPQSDAEDPVMEESSYRELQPRDPYSWLISLGSGGGGGKRAVEVLGCHKSQSLCMEETGRAGAFFGFGSHDLLLRLCPVPEVMGAGPSRSSVFSKSPQ